MGFDIAEYIRQSGFLQSRESDKRDIFEKEYFNAFHEKTYTACVTISYDSGYTKFNSSSIWLMTIELVNDQDRQTVFSGISPKTFDEAASILELVLPTPEYLKKQDIGG